MADLNTATSIVDFLKASGQDSSFSARSTLAQKYGITNYTGSGEQNTTLLGKLKAANVSASPSNVSNMGDATTFINANQDKDIATANKSDEPPVRNVAKDLTDAFKSLTGKSSLIPDVTVPAAPSYEQTYTNLRKQYGVDVLETSLNYLNSEADNIRAQFRVQKNAETGKPVAMNVIEGRISEEQKQANERLDVINNSINTITRQLTSANTAIENMMTFKKLDYETAKEQYNTEFSNNITLFNTVRGVYETQLTETERAADNARSNLQIIYNSISDGEANVATISDSMKAKITSLELQAGLPTGFYQSLKTANPKGKILSTTTRTTGGKKYADVIYQNTDGSLTTKQVYLGSSNEGSTTTTESDLEREARAKIVSYFDGLGTVTPEQYKAARKAWVADVKGATPSEFDDIFARDYLDAADYDAAGVSLY